MPRPDTYTLGVLWSPREEREDTCPERTSRWLSALADWHPLLREWYVLPSTDGDTPKPKPCALDAGSLEAEMQAEAEREELGGLKFSAWNGRKSDEESAAVDVWCAPISVSWMTSAAIAKWKSPGVAPSDAEIDRYREILAVSVAIWQPRHGFVITRRHHDALIEDERDDPDAPLVGWLTYIDRRPSELPAFDAPVRIEPMGGGAAIVLCDDIADCDPTMLAELSFSVVERVFV